VKKDFFFLTIIISEDDQNFTHRIIIMGEGNATTQQHQAQQQPMTNLRTAANSDKDDDPSALVPIPIATLGSTSIAEHREGRTNVEVVRATNSFDFFSLLLRL